MGNSCQSKLRQAAPSPRPKEVEAHVYLVLSDTQVVQVLDCPANLEDSFKDICGTAIQIGLCETKHKDQYSKRALKQFIPDWFAYKNGETCFVEEIDIEEEKRPFNAIYGPPLTSHATFVFAAKSVKQYLDREQREGSKGEYFGPYGLILRPNLEPHFYFLKGGKIVSYEGQKVKQGGRKPLTFLAKVMLAQQSSSSSSNATCVLSARNLAAFMGNRRNWTMGDIEMYFDELAQRNLGTKKKLEKFEGLAERKTHGFSSLHSDTLFYKKVVGERQEVELHKLGLKIRYNVVGNENLSRLSSL